MREGYTTSVWLNARERRLVEIAGRHRGLGPSAYIRRAAVAAAEEEVIAAAVELDGSSRENPAGRGS